MRSGTCRMLKLSTNAYVPFLIYAVSSIYHFLFNDKFKNMKASKEQVEKRHFVFCKNIWSRKKLQSTYGSI